jgi:hypothetical protein
MRRVQENHRSYPTALSGIDDPVVSLEFLAMAAERVRVVGHETDHPVFGHSVTKTDVEHFNADLFWNHEEFLHEVEALFPDFFDRELRLAHVLVQGGILDFVAQGRPLAPQFLGHKIEPLADSIFAWLESQSL